MQCNLEIRVKMLEDWSGSENNLELVESFLSPGGPNEFSKLFEQVCDWENDLQISFNEVLIEVRKVEKDLNIILRLWDRLINNGLDAIWIHYNAIRGNNET